jgi:hypothetical protein
MLSSTYSPLYISFPYCPSSVYPHFLISSYLPSSPLGSPVKAISFYVLSFLLVLSSILWPACGVPTLSFWLPYPHTSLTFHHWSCQSSALIDSFLYLKPISCALFTDRPDDEGSEYHLNSGKLLPDYVVLQHKKWWSSHLPL